MAAVTEPVVHIGENSPEHVAWRLMRLIADLERRSVKFGTGNAADRNYILDTYAECLEAAQGLRKHSNAPTNAATAPPTSGQSFGRFTPTPD